MSSTDSEEGSICFSLLLTCSRNENSLCLQCCNTGNVAGLLKNADRRLQAFSFTATNINTLREAELNRWQPVKSDSENEGWFLSARQKFYFIIFKKKFTWNKDLRSKLIACTPSLHCKAPIARCKILFTPSSPNFVPDLIPSAQT